MVIYLKNVSIWKENILNNNYPTLNKNKNVDVLIIGGGITGISTLYHLNKSNLNIMLVEQNKIGCGTTLNSTGKLTIMQNDLIDKIRKSFNDEIALKYIKSQEYAINQISKVIETEKIDCNLTKTPAIIYTSKKDEINKIRNLAFFFLKNKLKIENIKLPNSKIAIQNNDSYLINPIKFINGMLKKIKAPIFENTSIIKIEKKINFYLCHTKNNIIKAKKVVLASHYPFFLIPSIFPLKCSLEKSYLMAFKKSIKPISLISYSVPFISIRTYNNYLIYLSQTHFINKSTCDYDNFKNLKKQVKEQPDYLWSNIDLITNDGLPYIGKLKENLLIGTGYNTWGLASGFLAGEILSDIINNKDNEYSTLFNPKRFNLSHFKGYFSNSFKSISGFVDGILKSKNNKVCPHLGCKLLFNEIEKTWDCPCHGSRFDLSGKPLNGPGNKEIE